MPGSQGRRTWVGRREFWEAPAKDGGHVACGSEVASCGGLSACGGAGAVRFVRQREQLGPQSWPNRLVGEVLVGLVELCDGLGSDELFGCDVEAIGVALDLLQQPRRWVVELARQGWWRRRAPSSLAMICCSVSVGVRGEMVSGRMGLPGRAAWNAFLVAPDRHQLR
jgi:hypothetical protein